MSMQYAETDIYNKNNVLLFARGQELTPEVIEKLQQLDIIKRSEPESITDEIKIFNRSKDIKEKFEKLDEGVLRSSSKLLSDVIFSSKSSPWWMSVNALSNYVDWMYTHSIDVALISLIIATRAGFDENAQRQLCLGSLLHDIGKLLVPKNIIQKPGKLDEQELVLMRQHCDLGYGMVKDFNLDKACTDIILQHHERLDGSGYPRGLTGRDISESTKIVMIADVLDAITSYRPYKSIRELTGAVNELEKESDKFSSVYVGFLGEYLVG